MSDHEVGDRGQRFVVYWTRGHIETEAAYTDSRKDAERTAQSLALAPDCQRTRVHDRRRQLELKLGPLTRNGTSDETRPYLICDTSNGQATHRCGIAFGTPTGGQGWPALGYGTLTLGQLQNYAVLFAYAEKMYRLIERVADGCNPIETEDDAIALLELMDRHARKE